MKTTEENTPHMFMDAHFYVLIHLLYIFNKLKSGLQSDV